MLLVEEEKKPMKEGKKKEGYLAEKGFCQADGPAGSLMVKVLGSGGPWCCCLEKRGLLAMDNVLMGQRECTT